MHTDKHRYVDLTPGRGDAEAVGAGFVYRLANRDLVNEIVLICVYLCESVADRIRVESVAQRESRKAMNMNSPSRSI